MCWIGCLIFSDLCRLAFLIARIVSASARDSKCNSGILGIEPEHGSWTDLSAGPFPLKRGSVSEHSRRHVRGKTRSKDLYGSIIFASELDAAICSRPQR